MKTKLVYAISMIMFFAVLTGCDKEEVAPGGGIEKQPDIAQNGVLISTPEGLKNSENPFAQQIMGLFNSVNAVGDYMKLFRPPSGAVTFQSGINGASAWTWNAGNVQYWLVYYESGGKYIWKLDADQGSGREKFIYVEEAQDEKSGQADFYVPGQPAIHYTWNYDDDGNLNCEITYKGPEGNIKVDAVVNQDGSGSMEYYLNNELFLAAQWNKDGSGTWTIYTDSGTFTGQWSS